MKVSTIQLKMARAALGWTIRELAEKARIHVNTAQRIEAGLPAQSATLQTVQRVYEDAGLEFIFADSGGGPGVRLKLNAEIPAPGSRPEDSNEHEPDGLKGLDWGLVDHWRQRPQLWHSLSEAGQLVLSRAMFGEDRANEVRTGE